MQAEDDFFGCHLLAYLWLFILFVKEILLVFA